MGVRIKAAIPAVAVLFAWLTFGCSSTVRATEPEGPRQARQVGALEGQRVLAPLKGSVLRAVCVAQGAFLHDLKKNGVSRPQSDIIVSAVSFQGRIIVSFRILMPATQVEKRVWDYEVDPTSFRVLAAEVENPRK